MRNHIRRYKGFTAGITVGGVVGFIRRFNQRLKTFDTLLPCGTKNVPFPVSLFMLEKYVVN